MLGRLNFEYQHPYSRIRENYILSDIEREITKELLAVRVQVDAAILGGAAVYNKKLFDVPYDAFGTLAELTLPYTYKKDKIEATEDVGKIDKEYWINLLKEKRKELDTTNGRHE